jgi:hypothetical protein
MINFLSVSEHLNMEIEAHSVFGQPEPATPLVGPQFPGKNQAVSIHIITSTKQEHI